MADTGRRVGLGCHRNQGRIARSECLVGQNMKRGRKKEDQRRSNRVTQSYCKRDIVTSVALSAVADYLIGCVIGVAGLAIEVICAGVPRAGTGPAVIPRAKDWVPKEPVHTPATKEGLVRGTRQRHRERLVMLSAIQRCNSKFKYLH